MVIHWRLSDSKSPQVSRTFLSILAVFNNAVVWSVSFRPPTSKSSSPFNNPLVTVPKAPITIGIIVTFIFHIFFNSLARSRYLSLFSHSFSFILCIIIIIIIIVVVVAAAAAAAAVVVCLFCHLENFPVLRSSPNNLRQKNEWIFTQSTYNINTISIYKSDYVK